MRHAQDAPWSGSAYVLNVTVNVTMARLTITLANTRFGYLKVNTSAVRRQQHELPCSGLVSGPSCLLLEDERHFRVLQLAQQHVYTHTITFAG